MNRILRTFLLLSPLLLAACASKTTIRHSVGYEAVLKNQWNAVILPPTAHIQSMGAFGSKERLYNYEQEFEHLAADEALVDLKERGFQVKYLHRKDIDEAGAYEAYTHLTHAYDEARKQLYCPLEQEEKKAFALTKNVGSAAVELATKTHSDLIIMVDYEGAIQTNGSRALSLALTAVTGVCSGGPAETSHMVIGIIDGKKGDILWTNLAVDTSSVLGSAFSNLRSQKSSDSKKLEKLIDRIFKPLKIEGKGRRAPEAAYASPLVP